jgi:type I restriction enzyme S subunit
MELIHQQNMNSSDDSNGWHQKKISEIATVIRGASPRPKGDKRYYGGEIPRLMVEDVTRDGKYVTPSVDFLTEEGSKRSRPCKEGTLTIVCSGTVGIPSFLRVDACIHDGFLGIINIKKEISKQYLYYQFVRLKEAFDKSATHGGIFTNLTTSGVKDFVVPFPKEEAEQAAIATALSNIDVLISQTEKLIKKKKAIKQGVMQQLLKPKEGWVMKKFTDIVDYIHGKAHEQFIVDDGKFKVVNSKFISSNGEVVKYSNNSFLTAKKNDILTVLSDLPNGKALAKCFLVDINNLYAVNQRVCIWRSKGADPTFLYYLLNRHKYFLKLDDGVTQTHILNGDINKFELKITEDLVRQKEIGIILSEIDQEITILEKRHYKLKNQKQGMMQALLTGKIRLI